MDESQENVLDVSSSGVLSPDLLSSPAKRQATSPDDVGMLVSSMESFHVGAKESRDGDSSSDTDG